MKKLVNPSVLPWLSETGMTIKAHGKRKPRRSMIDRFDWLRDMSPEVMSELIGEGNEARDMRAAKLAL